tara:strand:- start:8964 stop:11411 length:2448 start_codon:yes stop_codon:yes gene_type:complete
MSTPLGSSQFFIDPFVEEGQSLRFEDSLSQYLSRTPASSGNTKTWTFSCWVKRGTLGSASYMSLFGALSGVLNSYIAYNTTHQALEVGQGATVFRRTSAVFRDVSAWYHVVVASDTTQATAANRIKIYINNEEITSFSTTTDLVQNGDWYFNDTFAHAVGAIYPSGSAGYFFDGYIANVTLIDGQQLDPTSFGKYQDTLWKPKSDADIQGLTFGTNGFYLNFADTSSLTTLGDDTSGNGNDFTLNNFSLNVAPLSDSPVLGGNFCTLDPNYTYNSGAGLSYGNLSHYDTTSGWTNGAGTFSVSSGKWYYETKVDNFNNSTIYTMIGLAKIGLGNVVNDAGYYSGQTATSYGLLTNGSIYNNNTATAYASALSNNDIVGVALDLDAGTLTYYINNVSQGTAFSGLSGEFFPVSGVYSGGINILNFGQDSSFAGTKTPQGNTDDNGVGDFYYAPPSGFLALKASNLPAPTITAPDEYFNTVLYSGNNTQLSVTGVNFQPDWTWIKKRNDIASHVLQDSVRGSFRYLVSNATNSENTDSANDWFRSFDSDGFTVSNTNTGGTATTEWNNSGDSYVAWNWLADTAFSNSAGTNGADLASTGRVNQDAGFSIVSFDLEATGSKTVAHGLSSAPEMIIVKSRDVAASWAVYTEPTGNTTYFLLDDDAGATANSTTWDNTSPTSSVFTMGSGFTSGVYGAKQIAYCFHSVEGYSKIGSYTGSTSLPFVHCGFRPSFLIVKRIGATDSGWIMVDSKRDSVNVVDKNLFPNADAAEESITGFLEVDFFANGFKLRTSNGASNAGSENYLFYAVAEAAFTRANAR